MKPTVEEDCRKHGEKQFPRHTQEEIQAEQGIKQEPAETLAKKKRRQRWGGQPAHQERGEAVLRPGGGGEEEQTKTSTVTKHTEDGQ